MKVETLNVIFAREIVELFPERFQSNFWAGDYIGVSHGDALWTLVTGVEFYEALRTCWEDGDWDLDGDGAETSMDWDVPWPAEVEGLRNFGSEDTLVALDG